MKIRKDEFRVTMKFTKDVESHIQLVIYPFLPQIQSREISVHLSKKNQMDFAMKTDWEAYKLILFNIV